MDEARNTTIVQDAYAAFLRGDIDTLLANVADDVDWHAVYGAGPEVPTSGTRRGRAQVREFFRQVAENISFSRFEPQRFVATGDTVVTLGHYVATTRTGRSFDSDFAMVFTLRDGKISRFQEFSDSAAINAAFAPTTAAA